MASYWWTETHQDEPLLRVAVFQGASSPNGDVASNVREVELQAKRASEEYRAHVLVVPEVFLSGYGLTRELTLIAARYIIAEKVMAHLQSIAQKYSIALFIGYPELEEEKIYNSVSLIDERGQILLTYRKTHLWAEKERALYTPGNALSPIVELRGVRVAAMICYDTEVSEVARCLTLRGAQLILVGTALGPSLENEHIVRTLVPARALENHIWIAYADFGSAGYLGLSCIVGPDGQVLAEVKDDPLIVAELNPKKYLRSIQSTPYLADRRPELYAPIIDPQYLARLPADYKYTNE